MMLKSEAINEISEALALAHSELTPPPRNRTVKVKGKSKTGHDFTYEFSYTTLDAVIETIRIPFTKNGLWFTQTVQWNTEGRYSLITTLLHKSGQWFSSETPLLLEDNSNQKFGSALTYMRRYALTAMAGVAAEEDDDGNVNEGNEREVRPRQPANKSKANVGQPVAPTNPATGDNKPHKIELSVAAKTSTGEEIPNWVLWGQQYLAGLQSSDKFETAEEWTAHNQDIIDRMQKESEAVFKRLDAAAASQMKKFSPAGTILDAG